MSSDSGPAKHDAQGPAGTTESGRGDAAHLDEDPEALEDPVHSGDAKHQHDLHAHPHPEAGSGQPD